MGSTIYVWPTEFCRSGCAHCSFSSVPISQVHPAAPRRNTLRDTDLQLKAMQLVKDAGVWKFVLSGGGEPMEEPEAVYNFVANVSSDRLEEIELITNGFWATDPSEAFLTLSRLRDYFVGRPSHAKETFKLRLSIDQFHRKALGLECLVNIVRLAELEEFDCIDVYLRSVKLSGDTSVPELAMRVGAQLTPEVDFQRYMVMPTGNRYLVYYKNLTFEGRLRGKRAQFLPEDYTSGAQFEKRLHDFQGRYIPARTYNGPEVRFLDGLALILEPDGAIKIVDGNSPDNVPNVRDRTWTQALQDWYRDPITVFLLEHGPWDLAEVMRELDPSTVERLREDNQIYYLVDRLLLSPFHRLWATVRILRIHLYAHRVEVEPSVLAEADDWLNRVIHSC